MFIELIQMFFTVLARVVAFLMNIELQPGLKLWYIFFFLMVINTLITFLKNSTFNNNKGGSKK